MDPVNEGKSSDSAVFVESVRVSMRSYFSTYHLYAARYSAEDAQQRESELTARESIFDIRHRRFVLESVAESVAFLEAAINEVFQDASDKHQSYTRNLGENCIQAMSAVWEATGQGHMETLNKYDLALQLAGNSPLNADANPYQSARRLIRLRNYLIHYRPHDVSVDTPHSLEKMLKGTFPPNQLMASSGNPWFPDHALGAGCANWAWRAARALVDEFTARMGVELNYQNADFGDPLP